MEEEDSKGDLSEVNDTGLNLRSIIQLINVRINSSRIIGLLGHVQNVHLI